jgi:hypothetical protein
MRSYVKALSGAAVLAAAVLAVPAAASASPAVQARPAGIVIFAPCTALEDGRYIVVGHEVYECVFVKGLGYYWVRYVPTSCPGVSDKAARVC